MELRNLQYNQDGSIDLEFKHSIYGWIPFTASENDTEETGRTIFETLINGDFGDIKPYTPISQIELEFISKEQAKAEALAYLSSTDWYIVRFMDSGVEVPQEIKDKRAEARLRV